MDYPNQRSMIAQYTQNLKTKSNFLIYLSKNVSHFSLNITMLYNKFVLVVQDTGFSVITI